MIKIGVLMATMEEMYMYIVLFIYKIPVYDPTLYSTPTEFWRIEVTPSHLMAIVQKHNADIEIIADFNLQTNLKSL
jgi:hypothetical protein